MFDKNNVEIEVGMFVIVPDPEPSLSDNWNHEFQGLVVFLTHDNYIVVEDGDGDGFTIEAERVEVIKE